MGITLTDRCERCNVIVVISVELNSTKSVKIHDIPKKRIFQIVFKSIGTFLLRVKREKNA